MYTPAGLALLTVRMLASLRARARHAVPCCSRLRPPTDEMNE